MAIDLSCLALRCRVRAMGASRRCLGRYGVAGAVELILGKTYDPRRAMNRRAFVTGLGAVLAAPLAAHAQPAGTVRRIGYLSSGSATSIPRNVEEFRQGLRELGLVEGQDIVIDYRFAEGRFDRLPDLAAELVRLKVDVIVAVPTPPAVAAKNATRTIPIVIISAGDPVGLGLVASLARPGGNVTGLSFSVGVETFGKGLELLKEAVPKVRRVAVLSNPSQSGPRGGDERREDRGPSVRSAASTPRGPRCQRVRRRLRVDGQRTRDGTPRSGGLAVYSPPSTARRPRAGDSVSRAADAPGPRSISEGRNRKVVAHHQGGEHQGRVTLGASRCVRDGSCA